MRALFVGGTGLISSACSAAAVAAGHELWLLNRGRSRLEVPVPPERTIVADAYDEAEVRGGPEGAPMGRRGPVGRLPSGPGATGHRRLLRRRPVRVHFHRRHLPEAAEPLADNREDAAVQPVLGLRAPEDRLREGCWWRRGSGAGSPTPSSGPRSPTGVSQIPVVIGSWDKPFTIIDRMRRGAPIIVPGDGTSLWTITHNSDFAKGLLGLLGNPAAIGQDFHITSDEARVGPDLLPGGSGGRSRP